MPRFLATKPLSILTKEAYEVGENTLRRSLGPVNLITLGIGAIIGAGIFVLTGQAAALHAGPAVALSFVFAGITCAFAGLCYSEFASIIPIAGSAYTYGYATLGELVAWIIGWDLVLEYAFGAATVASGWSGYFVSLLEQLHLHLPPQFTTTYGNVLYLYSDRWLPAASLPSTVNTATLPHVAGVFNFVAFFAILIVTAVLVIGIKESANLNSAIVIVKLTIVGVFLVLGIGYLFHHPELARANWHPFIPPAQGPGMFGFGGITAGAASVFFAYIGFDAVSTAAQEARNPQRDMPIGILGSLVVCTLLYILVSTVLTGLVNYRSLDVSDPVAVGIDVTGVTWGSLLVKIGAVFGLVSRASSIPCRRMACCGSGLRPSILSSALPGFLTSSWAPSSPSCPLCYPSISSRPWSTWVRCSPSPSCVPESGFCAGVTPTWSGHSEHPSFRWSPSSACVAPFIS
jgi:APA family basic amino acid/polyamine antiporter